MKKYWIYSILNSIDGKMYIGSTQGVRNRKSNHMKQLKKGIHKCIHLQRASNKYGYENFKFNILEEGEMNFDYFHLLEIEEKWVVLFDTINPDKGYNSRLPTEQPFLEYAAIKSKDGYENYLLTKGPHGLKNISLDEWQKNRTLDSNFTLRYVGNPRVTRKIHQVDINNFKIIKTWESIKNASDSLSIAYNKISDCLSYNKIDVHRPRKYKDYMWFYSDIFSEDFDFTIYKNRKRKFVNIEYKTKKEKEKIQPSIIQLVNESGEIKEFSSLRQISEFLDVAPSNVSDLKRGWKNKGGGRISKVNSIRGWKFPPVVDSNV